MSSHQRRSTSTALIPYTPFPRNHTRNYISPYSSIPSPRTVQAMETRTDIVTNALRHWAISTFSYPDSDLDNTDNDEEQEREDKCPICFEKFLPLTTVHPSMIEKPVRTPCRHTFGHLCLGAWLDTSDTCPLCRTQLIFFDSASISPSVPSLPPLSPNSFHDYLLPLAITPISPTFISRHSSRTQQASRQDTSSFPPITDALLQAPPSSPVLNPTSSSALMNPRFFSPLPYDSFSRTNRHRQRLQYQNENENLRTREVGMGNWRANISRTRVRASSTTIMQLLVLEHPSFPRLQNTIPQQQQQSGAEISYGDEDDGYYYMGEEISQEQRGVRLRATQSLDEGLIWGGDVIPHSGDSLTYPRVVSSSSTAPVYYGDELRIPGVQVYDIEFPEEEGNYDYNDNDMPLHYGDRDVEEEEDEQEEEITHAHPAFRPYQNATSTTQVAIRRRSETDNYARTEYPESGIPAYSLTNNYDGDGRRRYVEEFWSEAGGYGYGYDYGYGYEYGYGVSSDGYARHARARSASLGGFREGRRGRGRGGQRGGGRRGEGRDGYGDRTGERGGRGRGRGRGRERARSEMERREWRIGVEMGRGPTRQEVEDELACFGRLGDSIWAD